MTASPTSNAPGSQSGETNHRRRGWGLIPVIDRARIDVWPIAASCTSGAGRLISHKPTVQSRSLWQISWGRRAGRRRERRLALIRLRDLERGLAPDPNFLDSGPLDGFDPKLRGAQLERRADLGGGAQLVQHVAADGVVVVAGDSQLEQLVDVVDADAPVQNDFVGRDKLD